MVPLPASILNKELLPRVKELLGLPLTATFQQVINAQDAERQRRADLAGRQSDKTVTWWNYPIPPEDEHWLFVDTTGLPVKPELHDERWHRVRAWVEKNDGDNAWPRTIVYRNLRHHAAINWFHEELGESWEVVAQNLGDKLTTVLNHYVRAGGRRRATRLGRQTLGTMSWPMTSSAGTNLHTSNGAVSAELAVASRRQSRAVPPVASGALLEFHRATSSIP